MQYHRRHRHHRHRLPANLVLALLLLANILAFYVLGLSGWFSVPKGAEPSPAAFSRHVLDEPTNAEHGPIPREGRSG